MGDDDRGRCRTPALAIAAVRIVMARRGIIDVRRSVPHVVIAIAGQLGMSYLRGLVLRTRQRQCRGHLEGDREREDAAVPLARK
ncbi:MAG: hypothetical protein U5O39_00055 [Gammaproteobacteria bacterium]|nr:hypothetical protein [Gammaproteobacteria bacterium]